MTVVQSTEQVLDECFNQLVAIAQAAGEVHSNKQAKKASQYLQFKLGPGISIDYGLGRDWWQVCLYFPRDSSRAWLEHMVSHRAALESAFGDRLDIEPAGDSPSRVKYRKSGMGYASDKSKWPRMHGEMIGAMARLYCAVLPHLSTFPSEQNNAC